jgi:sulfonate transport system permease protein
MRRCIVIIGPLILLTVWSSLTYPRLISPLFLPTPAAVAGRLYQLFSSGEIFPDLGLSAVRWIVGLVVGSAIGIPFGLILGYSNKVYRSLEVVVDFFRSVPVISLFPLFLVIFGIGNTSKIAIAAWTALLAVLINTMYGVKHAKETHLMAARALRATSLQIFTKIAAPGALPDIFVGMRIAVSLSLIIVVAAEMMMGTSVGLGRVIYDAALMHRMSEMYAGILLTGFLGYLSNKLFVLLERKIVHWTGK